MYVSIEKNGDRIDVIIKCCEDKFEAFRLGQIQKELEVNKIPHNYTVIEPLKVGISLKPDTKAL